LSISGKIFRFVQYGVDLESELIDYDEIQSLAKKEKPKLIVAGASAYSRLIDYKKFREISDSIGALLLVDMAHIAGLVASGTIPSPVPFAHFVTSSTHKTLRGPRGGLILCKEEFGEKIDKTLFPGLQGGPLENVIAAKAVCFLEAGQPEFREYCQQVIENATVLAKQLEKNGFRLVSGGTDNHLLNIDFGQDSFTGKEAEGWLESADIIVNREVVPRDTRKPYISSGIRLGSPTLTTRGFKENEMRQVANLLTSVLKSKGEEKMLREVKADVGILTKKYPFLD
jgi:glycine hydroxymethyltransferase